MSTFNIRDIREISNEPLTKFANKLAKKFSAFQTAQQTEKLENKEDIYSAGQDVDSVIKFHSLVKSKHFDFLTQYYSPLEPDNDKLRLWIRGTNTGNTMRDWALLDRNIELYGDPQLVDGTPFDDGIVTGDVKSTAVRFNRPGSPFEGGDYIQVIVGGATSMNIVSKTKMSYFVRFKVFDLADFSGQARTLFEKIDDDTPTDGVMLTITSSGRLRMVVKQAGVEYKKHTTNVVIATNTVYDVWVTYNSTGNVIHIYVNNVDQALTTNTDTITWHTTLTNHDFNVMRRGVGSSGGYVYGDLYDFRVYNEKEVSSTEVGYHYTNKWTISNIPFGQVMVSNYWATNWTIGSGYTTTGFTTIGYDT